MRCFVRPRNGGSGLWHVICDRHWSGQLSFEGSWSLLLNNNSGELVPITDCSDSKWVAQPSHRCPFSSSVCTQQWVQPFTAGVLWLSKNVWELALTANGVWVSSILELYVERMRIYTSPYGVQVVIAVKVVLSEKQVTLVGCLSGSGPVVL